MCWFLVWDLDPLSSCHMTTCFYWVLLPCIVDVMGSFVWRVEYDLKMPIGGMILLTLHDVCFQRSNGQPIIFNLRLSSSCGRIHLENLSFWRRHFMVYLFDGVAWATLGGHEISSQDQEQPQTYHKWREKPLDWEDPISPCSPNTLYEPGVEDILS